MKGVLQSAQKQSIRDKVLIWGDVKIVYETGKNLRKQYCSLALSSVGNDIIDLKRGGGHRRGSIPAGK